MTDRTPAGDLRRGPAGGLRRARAGPEAGDPRRDSGAVPVYGAELAAEELRLAEDEALAQELAETRATIAGGEPDAGHEPDRDAEPDPESLPGAEPEPGAEPGPVAGGPGAEASRVPGTEMVAGQPRRCQETVEELAVPPEVAAHPNGAGSNGASSSSATAAQARGRRHGPPPAHSPAARRTGRDPDHVRRDRRSTVTRLPVVAVLAAALVGAVAADGSAGGRSHDRAGAAEARPGSLMPASPPADTDTSTWYCAAGTAGEEGFADHIVTMANTSAVARTATLTVFGGAMAAPPAPDESGATTTTAPPAAPAPAPVSQAVPLPAGGQVSVRLGDVVAAPLAAALVEVDGSAVAVEHSVRGRHGRDVAPCSTTASPAWHFAWGATTRDALEVVVLFNPFPSTAVVDTVFVTEQGGREPVRLQGLPVPGHSVVGVDVGEDVTRSEQVSATFTVRSGRLVVERLQQYDGSLGPRGLALTLGAPSAGEAWAFADGVATGPSPATPAPDEEDDDEDDDEGEDASGSTDELARTERIVVYNPGDERAEVDVNVVPSDADVPLPQPFRLSIGAGRYEVVDLGAEDRVPAGTAHATIVRSTNGEPVVAERVTVDTGPAPSSSSRRPPRRPPARPSEVTASLGARLAAPVWAFPSLADPVDDDGTTAFMIHNPDPDTAVEARLVLADRSEPAPTAEAREPVDVAPGASAVILVDGTGVGAAIEADGPVVVERLLRPADGRRMSSAPGIPGAGEAVVLDDAVAEGWLVTPTA
jgi:hypothetical protein